MKQLLVMRHGKAELNKPGQEDIDRPLAPRGHGAAVGVATWIKEHDLQPDAALVSAARRTRETWQVAADAMDGDVSTQTEETLYLASPGAILEQIAGVADSAETLIVIAHNPGLESLSHMLAGAGSAADALENLQRGFPAGALAVFELAGDRWSRLSADGAKLTHFVRPRELD